MIPFFNFHVTVRGASHVRKGVCCQDFSKSVRIGEAAVAAVADGHGDIRYFRSNLGSRFAVESALKSIREFVRREDPVRDGMNTEAKMLQLKKNIILNWNLKVNRHLSQHPFLVEELAPLSENRRENLKSGRNPETAYGTTLIAAAVTPDYWFGLQIGDGDCTETGFNGSREFVPKESGLLANITTSLCESDAIDKFHHFFCAERPASVILSTDGVKNSFSSGEDYLKFVQKVANSFSMDQYVSTRRFLKEFMHEMTVRGSGDDLSIAGLIWLGGPLRP